MNSSNTSNITAFETNFSNSTDINSGTTTLGVAYTIISISVMIANGVIIYVIAKTDELHMNALCMLTFRAITDFSFGLYYLVFVVPSAFLHTFAYPENFIGCSSCISTFLTGQTIFNIALTVIDRCIAILKPLAYVRIVTKRNFILAVVFSISVSVIRLFMVIFPDVDFYYNADIALCVVDFDTNMTVIASVGIPLLTFIIIVITSCVIAAELRRGQRRIDSIGGRERISKFPVMVMMSVAVFCLCYTPFIVSVVWNLVAKKENVPILLIQVTTLGLLSNSLWNVFIYTGTYRPFRQALMRHTCKLYYREQRRAEISSSTN